MHNSKVYYLLWDDLSKRKSVSIMQYDITQKITSVIVEDLKEF